jgi:hypothetical protein
MKIGLIGNMNNSNFSLMRYLRDLGADAHLLLYTGDGEGSLDHFKPECDSWDIEKWKPFIHKTSIPNTPVAALSFPYSWIIGFRSMIRSWIGLANGLSLPVTKTQIHSAYAGYDRLVASGITPATLSRAGITLDIFFPYSSGVEFLRTGEFVVRFGGRFGIKRLIFNRVAQMQIKGICAARNVLNAEMAITHDVLLDIGVEPRKLPIVSIYSSELQPEAPPTNLLQVVYSAILNSDFTVLHHSRLLWVNPGGYSKEDWIKENKNSDWLLYGFSALIKNRPNLKPLLFIVEYGPDITATKRLAIELGVDSYIHWLPKMDRRELMWLLSHVSVGVGEFYDLPKMIWGGTGWEVLASHKPLLQGFNFKGGEYEQIFGYPPPPILPVQNQDDIFRHLVCMADHPEKREEIGHGAKEWFDRYNGIGLAKQWLEILTAPRKDKNHTVTVKQGAYDRI